MDKKKRGNIEKVRELLASIKHITKQEKLKDDFFDLLFKIHTSRNRVEKYYMIKKAKSIARKVPELKDWPKGSIFWDIESGMWEVNIQKEVREFIKKELKKLLSQSTPSLSLGSGNYPYLKNSVLVDYSKSMIDSAPKEFRKKVLFDLDSKNKLPFKNNSFKSCTMVFVTNYLKNLDSLFKEIYRILKKSGTFVIVNSADFTSELYREQEKNHYTAEQLKYLLFKNRFRAKALKKKLGNFNLVFIIAKK